MKHFAIFIFFLFIYSLNLSAEEDFEVIRQDFEQGKYQYILDEYEFLYQKWLKDGRLDEYIASRRDLVKEGVDHLKNKLRVQRKNQKQLHDLNRYKNKLLMELCEDHPDLKISNIVRRIVRYHQLAMKYEDSVAFLNFLDLGAINTLKDPLVLEIQQLLFNYHLKSIVLSSLLIDCCIDPKTAAFHSAIISLDKNVALKKICDAHPESQPAAMCLEAIQVDLAKLPVAYEQKYLSDLLVGMRAPINEIEDEVRYIIKKSYLHKMAILDKG